MPKSARAGTGTRERQAWKRVKANKGSAGIDGKTIEETALHLRKQWLSIRESLL